MSKLPKDVVCRWCKGAGYFPNKLTMVGSASKVRKDCDVCKGKGSFPPFTEEDKNRFKTACLHTWGAIADDVMALAPRMSLAAKVEVTLDADYMDMYGVPGGMANDFEKRKALTERNKQIRYSGPVAERWAREALKYA